MRSSKKEDNKHNIPEVFAFDWETMLEQPFNYANINNELYECKFGPDTPQGILLAYGYARLWAAAGLRLQGVFSFDDFHHALHILSALVSDVDKREQVLKRSKQEAIEFIKSYDPELTIEIISAMVNLASHEDVYQLPKGFFPYQVVKLAVIRTLAI